MLGPLPAADAVSATLCGVAGQEQYAVVPGCVVVGVGCVQRVLMRMRRAGTKNVAVVGQTFREVVVEQRTEQAVENRPNREQDEVGLDPDLEPAASFREDVHHYIIDTTRSNVDEPASLMQLLGQDSHLLQKPPQGRRTLLRFFKLEEMCSLGQDLMVDVRVSVVERRGIRVL